MSAHMVSIPEALAQALVAQHGCVFDRHRGCQAHGYLSLDGAPCPQAELRDWLGLPALPVERDQPERWYVIVCRACWPEATLGNLRGEMPFRTAEERGRWAAAHREGTGHDSWIQLTRPPRHR